MKITKPTPIKFFIKYHVLPLVFAAVFSTTAFAQRVPHIGYIYPAGGQVGTEFEIIVGGQFLNGVKNAYVSGDGVSVEIIRHRRPLGSQRMSDLRKVLIKLVKDAQEKAKGENNRLKRSRKRKNFSRRLDLQNLAKTLDTQAHEKFQSAAKKLGLADYSIKEFQEAVQKRRNPKNQQNAQLGETVTLKVSLSTNAKLGSREFRLVVPQGLTNPLRFHISQYPEYREAEPNDITPDSGVPASLPAIINGQILPGDVDKFTFTAKHAMDLVATVDARTLIPYLADAVPGWFQATLTLRDSKGKEIAFSDDFRFHPDPVIHYKIPAAGKYTIEINDSIYRGREDFVYRISLGAIPYITSVFPLGGKINGKTPVLLEGWNLRRRAMMLDCTNLDADVTTVSIGVANNMSNRVSFTLSSLPQILEKELNNDIKHAQSVSLPVIINGKISRIGDWDVFCFEGEKGLEIIAEVKARRLGSPLDSLLKITDSNGKILFSNDDCTDKCAGLTTHQADSALQITIPTDGKYYIHIGDIQNKGGQAYAYQLRLAQTKPDFALRVVPATINTRSGITIPITIHAFRKEGFDGDISLSLNSMPRGFSLKGGFIPAGTDKIQATLTVPFQPTALPSKLRIKGTAVIDGVPTTRLALAAEDMMQAFLYRHIVEMKECLIAMPGGGRIARRPKPNRNKNKNRKTSARGTTIKILNEGRVKLTPGKDALIYVAAPQGPFLSQIQLELNNPPPGIKISSVSPNKNGLVITLAIDATAAPANLKGNLIIDIYLSRTSKPKKDKPARPARRIAIGSLPAIPFEIIKK